MSNGRLDITRYWAGGLVDTPQILHAVGAGTIEMGHSCGVWYPEMELGAIEGALPMAWSSMREAIVFYEYMGFEDLLREVYAEQNAYHLTPTYEDLISVLTKEPVNSLNDLREMKIYAAGDFGTLLANVGVPVTDLAFEEAPMALGTGVIDGAAVAAVLLYAQYGYLDHAKYYLDEPLLDPVTCHLIVNMDAWNELPDDLKQILVVGAEHFAWSVFREAGAGEYLQREEYGIITTTLPPEDRAELAQAAVSLWEEAAARSPRCAQAIDMVKELNRALGRIE